MEKYDGPKLTGADWTCIKTILELEKNKNISPRINGILIAINDWEQGIKYDKRCNNCGKQLSDKKTKYGYKFCNLTCEMKYKQPGSPSFKKPKPLGYNYSERKQIN